MSARAALDAARAVFDLRESSRVDASTPESRGRQMWLSAEQVLQAALRRPELTGQALVGEARRVDYLSLVDAHALVALQGWVDRQRDTASAQEAAALTDVERNITTEAWTALEHAVEKAEPMPPSPWAQPSAQYAPPTWSAQSSPPLPSPVASPLSERPSEPPRNAWDASVPVPARPWYASTTIRVVALLLVIGGAFAAWWQFAPHDGDYRDGVAAYQRGSRETARTSFARYAQQHPEDARPLIYLGRLAREDNDLVLARRFLDAAVRRDPSNASGLREYAAALLADSQPEMARRFYVRALSVDPVDKLSQGFLACSLHQLGRDDEAKRWADRAGAGEWTPCLESPSGKFAPKPTTAAPSPASRP